MEDISMKMRTSRGFLALLIVSLWSCVNPFFASLHFEEKIDVVSSHTVTFNLNDGADAVVTTKTVAPPATSIGAGDFPGNPTRSGYTFAGWNTAADGSGSSFTAASTVDADMDVYARWAENKPGSHTVIFKMNDETETVWAAKTVEPPATGIAAEDFPADPERTDYAFVGWNTAEDGSGSSFTVASEVSADTTVYARWTPVTPGSHTVTFRLNYGAAANHDVITVTPPATTVAELPLDPERTGYTFTGWNTLADGSGDSFTATFTVSADMAVYAQWTGNTYAVRFIRNHTQADTTILHTGTVIVPATALAAADFPGNPTRGGYTFVNWNTRADGSGSPFTVSAGVSADTDVYAQWTEIPPGYYAVTFKMNDGTAANHDVIVVLSATNIGTADFPASPERTGYTFAGWNTAADGPGSSFTATTAVSAAIEVYARWNPEPYNITYHLNEGSNDPANPASYTVESPDIILAAPSRDHYIFRGWYVDGGFAGSAVAAIPAGSTGNKTFYARWIPAVSVAIDLPPVPGNPPLSAVCLYENSAAPPFSAAGTGYTKWQWYWDGEKIDGATASTYALADSLKTSGIYELSVVVTTAGGATLSARCRVTIKAV
jgi:uncharacterized repeat protein (TIGR02543 family)